MIFLQKGCQVVKTRCSKGRATCWRLSKVVMRLTSDSLENWREKGTKSPAKGSLLP